MHLPGTGLIHTFLPAHQRDVLRYPFYRFIHRSDRITIVRMAAGAVEQVSVHGRADICCGRVARLVRLERDGMVLVERLAVGYGFGRPAVVVIERPAVRLIFRLMFVLPHIEVEWRIVVESPG